MTLDKQKDQFHCLWELLNILEAYLNTQGHFFSPGAGAKICSESLIAQKKKSYSVKGFGDLSRFRFVSRTGWLRLTPFWGDVNFEHMHERFHIDFCFILVYLLFPNTSMTEGMAGVSALAHLNC